MLLYMRSFKVRDALLGQKTAFADGLLTINAEELQAILLLDGDQFDSVEVALAKPGEKVRIVHVLDAVEPRVKVQGDASAFPGFIGPPHRAGNGITARLEGIAILTCAEFPEYGPDSMMGANEGIIDMTGPGAALSPFGSTINLVLIFKRKKGATTAGFSSAIRMASLKAANWLAQTVKDAAPDTETRYSLESVSSLSGLPRVGAVYLLSSLSLPLRESFIYGHPVGGMLPTILHPNEMLDGAVVGNYFVYSGVRNPTYFYQNNPVLQELYKQHSRELNLIAAIVTRAGDTSSTGKLNQAATAAQLGRLLQLDGVVVSANAGGQQVADLMFVCQQFEKQGIKTVGILAEMADSDGADCGLVNFVPEADALISVGNREELVELPSMEVVIGGEKLLDGQDLAGAELKVPLRHIYCSSTQLGAWNIRAKAF